jgi:hypothetical protein
MTTDDGQAMDVSTFVDGLHIHMILLVTFGQDPETEPTSHYLPDFRKKRQVVNTNS